MRFIGRLVSMLVALGMLVVGQAQAALTNSISSVYSATTGGFETTFDAYIGLAILCLLASVGLALANKFLPKKKKVA